MPEGSQRAIMVSIRFYKTEPKVLLRHPLNIFGPSIIPAILFCLISPFAYGSQTIEVSGSPYATDGTPLPAHVRTQGEKLILVKPNAHAWGAYNARGKLMRWGIATAGSQQCNDTRQSCRTKTGYFRVYSAGDVGCVSNKFPLPDGGAPMPYCMYFSGGQAIHGSDEVAFENVSHGCVRVHVDDAKWLRYHFVEGPTLANQYRGTRVLVEAY
jgi:lipoprotein-anchoring transpeptidase ErfK/SrfK